MTRDDWTRRTVLAALSAGLAMPAVVAAAAEQAPAARFRGVAVDTSRLGRLGSPATAEAVRDLLGRDMLRVFADLMAPRGSAAPTLVARIDSISLAAYTGANFDRRGGQSSNDFLEGAGLVMSSGQVLGTTPILAVLPASYSGAWYLPDIDARRIASITYQFAYWLRRDMGL